ncbi:hypothetical protein VTJ49DRAFT_500 [Mycothermus thermophilus]|uniref:GRF-like zinc ribbon domain-containing protein n=1 Tax=Humicola insolens TaxID=85995 RepID=A0ABR3VF97_HUMIN
MAPTPDSEPTSNVPHQTSKDEVPRGLPTLRSHELLVFDDSEDDEPPASQKAQPTVSSAVAGGRILILDDSEDDEPPASQKAQPTVSSVVAGGRILILDDSEDDEPSTSPQSQRKGENNHIDKDKRDDEASCSSRAQPSDEDDATSVSEFEPATPGSTQDTPEHADEIDDLASSFSKVTVTGPSAQKEEMWVHETSYRNANGNAGRPYYKCLYCPYNEHEEEYNFLVFRDQRGNLASNPPCECGASAKTLVDSPRKGRRVHLPAPPRFEYFLLLPVEIRIMIYDSVLRAPIPSGGTTPEVRFFEKKNLALLRVNKLVGAEAARHFYSVNTFCLSSDMLDNLWLEVSSVDRWGAFWLFRQLGSNAVFVRSISKSPIYPLIHSQPLSSLLILRLL